MTFLDLLGMALRFFPFFGLELVKTVAQNTLPASAKKALGIGPKPTFEDDLLDLSGRVVFVTGGEFLTFLRYDAVAANSHDLFIRKCRTGERKYKSPC